MWNSISQFLNKFLGRTAEPVEDAAQLTTETILFREEAEGASPPPRSGQTTRSLEGVITDTTTVIPVGEDGNPICIDNPKFYWILDNGHGKLQKGKRSPKFEDGSQFEEWEFTRDIVARMIPKLEYANVQFLNLVPEVEIGSFLTARVNRANAATHPMNLNKIYVSIHANAYGTGAEWSDSQSARGIETWHYPGSDSGMKISSVFQREIIAALGWKDRGIRSHQTGSSNIFYVLQNTSMPAVLTENGFYTNKEETQLLKTEEIRQLIADAHVAAILHIEQEGFQDQELYRPRMILA